MKIKDWSQRIMCFVLGTVVAGFLIFSSTSHGKRAETGFAMATGQNLQQRVALLEERVDAMEGRFRQIDAAAAAAKQRPKEEPTPRQPANPYREPKDPPQ